MRGNAGCCATQGWASWAVRGGGVLAGLESAACERPVGVVQWKGRSNARGREEKRAVAGRAGDGASWAAVLGRRERKEAKMAWAGLG